MQFKGYQITLLLIACAICAGKTDLEKRNSDDPPPNIEDILTKVR